MKKFSSLFFCLYYAFSGLLISGIADKLDPSFEKEHPYLFKRLLKAERNCISDALNSMEIVKVEDSVLTRLEYFQGNAALKWLSNAPRQGARAVRSLVSPAHEPGKIAMSALSSTMDEIFADNTRADGFTRACMLSCVTRHLVEYFPCVPKNGSYGTLFEPPEQTVERGLAPCLASVQVFEALAHDADLESYSFVKWGGMKTLAGLTFASFLAYASYSLNLDVFWPILPYVAAGTAVWSQVEHFTTQIEVEGEPYVFDPMLDYHYEESTNLYSCTFHKR